MRKRIKFSELRQLVEDVGDLRLPTVVGDGMLPTLPFDEFMALDKQLGENTAVSRFDWNTFINSSETIPSMLSYLEKCGCKKLGSGSSRDVYALERGDVDSSYVKGPCVLKVATSPTRGVAQNRAETVILGKYQYRLECFTKLYAYDNRNWHFLLVEVGTPLDSAPVDFVKKQFTPLSKYFERYVEDHEIPNEEDEGELCDDDFDIGCRGQKFASTVMYLLEILSGDRKVSDPVLLWVCDLTDNMVKSSSALVRGVGCVMKYAMEHGSRDVSLSDFGQVENWGFVKRDGHFMLIPIDWGATKEVLSKYYRKTGRRAA